jgi:hypothetical protein
MKFVKDWDIPLDLEALTPLFLVHKQEQNKSPNQVEIVIGINKEQIMLLTLPPPQLGEMLKVKEEHSNNLL